MRIHTNKPDAVRSAVHDAARRLPGVYPETTTHGSRKRGAAIELAVSADEGKGRRRRNGGSYGATDDYAATWDEWGVIFAAIFAADPDATCYAYDGADDYHHQTGDRFRSGDMPSDPHANHRFEYVGGAGNATTGRTWRIYKCKGSRAHGACSAVKRSPLPR